MRYLLSLIFLVGTFNHVLASSYSNYRDYFERGQADKDCLKFYEKIVEVSPNIYVVSSSDSKWDAELKLDDIYKLVRSAFDEFKASYPGLFAKMIAPRGTYKPIGISITVSTEKQAKKYDERCFIDIDSIGNSGGPMGNVHIQADHKRGDEFAKIFKSVLFHELAHNLSIPDIEDRFDKIMENKKIWNKEEVSWIRENEDEYFAELFAIWMGYPWFYGKVLGVKSKSDSVNDIREKLKKYDRESYDLVKEVLTGIESSASSYIQVTIPPSNPISVLTSIEIGCESKGYDYTICQTNRREIPKSILLVKQKSKSACILNQSYGISSNAIFTDRGCRGSFKLTY